jgi:hypothetical protein
VTSVSGSSTSEAVVGLADSAAKIVSQEAAWAAFLFFLTCKKKKEIYGF